MVNDNGKSRRFGSEAYSLWIGSDLGVVIWFKEQVCTVEQYSKGFSGSFKIGSQEGAACDQNDIPSRLSVFDIWIYRCTNQSFCPVSLDGPTQRAPCCHRKAGIFNLVCQCNQHDKRVGKRFTISPHPLEIGCLRQSISALHSLF